MVPVVEARTSAFSLPHGLGEDAHVGETQMLDQRREVAGVVARIRAAGNGGGGSKSAVREGDASVTGGEMGDLLPPRQVVAAEPVRKHDRRAGACYLVMDAVRTALKAADAAGGQGRMHGHEMGE
jgi:hypothetical protein